MLFVNRLVHTLVPGSEDEPVDTTCRTNAGFAASLICIGLNIALCLAKGIAGLLAGSVSLIADAFNNLSDASSNIVSLLGFRLASRPADEGHPYGHGRYEYLAGLFVAVLVCAVGINLVLESVTKIIKPSPTAYTLVSLAALAASMLVKLWMAAFNRTLGDRIDSETLIATAQDSKNDVITSGSVLAAALISQTTGFDLDGFLAYAQEHRIPAVIATTGLSNEQVEEIKTAASVIPVFFSANMSLGINLLMELVRKAAAVLGNDFDIEILEKHHNQKLDAPSGTALMLAQAASDGVDYHPEFVYERHSVRKKRDKTEIDRKSTRLNSSHT